MPCTPCTRAACADVTVPAVAKTKGAVKKPARTTAREGGQAPGAAKVSPPIKVAAKLRRWRSSPSARRHPPASSSSSSAAPAQRDEMIAVRDIGRLLRYGEQFGAHKIDVRMLPLQLAVGSGALACSTPPCEELPRLRSSRRCGPVPRDAERRAQRGQGAPRRDRDPCRSPTDREVTVAHYRGRRSEVRGSAPARPRDLRLARAARPAMAHPVRSRAAPTGVTPLEVSLTDGRRALALRVAPASSPRTGGRCERQAVCLVVDFDVFTQKDWKSRLPERPPRT